MYNITVPYSTYMHTYMHSEAVEFKTVDSCVIRKLLFWDLVFFVPVGIIDSNVYKGEDP